MNGIDHSRRPRRRTERRQGAVALHVALETAVHDGLAQMFTPPPPTFGPGKPGVGHERPQASCAAPTAGVSSAHARRLTSSRFSPSGKSLPSSPPVLTTSRRLAPLLLLLIGLAFVAVASLDLQARRRADDVRRLEPRGDRQWRPYLLHNPPRPGVRHGR